jgi:16S rRNA (guanine527-N7)-methyltransferase
MERRIFERLEQAGVGVSEDQALQLATYLELMKRWNAVYNLTGITDDEEMIGRHLIESLAFGRYLKGQRIADVGSGAGLPGIPLAVVFGDRSYTLIESRAKRVRFLRHVCGVLKLGNTTVKESRAENLNSEQLFDTVLARAVAAPPELLRISQHLLAEDGVLLVLTKASFENDATSMGHGVQVRCIKDSVTSVLQGSLVLVENAAT